MVWKMLSRPCSCRPVVGVKIGLFSSAGSWRQTREKSQNSDQTLTLLRHLVHTNTNTPTCAQEANLGGEQRQAHAFQVAPLLTEDKVLLLGFGNDKLELDLLPQHGRAEGESVEGALRQLQHTHMHN